MLILKPILCKKYSFNFGLLELFHLILVQNSLTASPPEAPKAIWDKSSCPVLFKRINPSMLSTPWPEENDLQ